MFLKTATQSAISVLLTYGEHMRPVNRTTVMQAGDSENEPDHAAGTVKRSFSNAADFLYNLENRRRYAFPTIFSPGFLLEADALPVVLI